MKNYKVYVNMPGGFRFGFIIEADGDPDGVAFYEEMELFAKSVGGILGYYDIIED